MSFQEKGVTDHIVICRERKVAGIAIPPEQKGSQAGACSYTNLQGRQLRNGGMDIPEESTSKTEMKNDQ
ncbi:MAG: hypothetical protein CVU64_17670 [Deltaproteobacteria bacterium HGW-Deltaproteobacteria-21]|nr:MAG: hypothetical protein CVU64_17670 [Deltaproteobacteria bacterium HGW-Deltaproteobacteria-21]